MSKKKKKLEQHPTFFVFDGVVRCYSDGSMLGLQSQVTDAEWKIIINDTISYHIFIECLKETAFPLLKERWTVDDEYWRLQLELAVSRIKNIDPIGAMAVKTDDIKKAMTAKMKLNATCLSAEIEQLRITQKSHTSSNIAPISNL